MRRSALAGAIAVVAIMGPHTAAHAQSVDFSGVQVEVFTPGSPGGGNDIYARTLTPHLAAALPGSPEMLVLNLPGAGTIAGSNQFEANAEPDGHSLLSVSASTVVNYALGDSRVEYDVASWEPVILSPLGSIVYVSANVGIDSPEDLSELREADLAYAGNSPTSADLGVLLAFNLLDLDVRPVWGMSRGPSRLAFERGETNINFDSTVGFLSSQENLEASGGIVPLFTFGVLDEQGDVVRDPNFPDVPTVPELYEMVNGTPPEGPAYDAWHSLFVMTTMVNKALVLPAGTPDDVLEAYRQAAVDMTSDPAVQEAASSVFNNYPQFVGEAAEPVIESAVNVDQEVIDWLNGWLQETYDVPLGG